MKNRRDSILLNFYNSGLKKFQDAGGRKGVNLGYKPKGTLGFGNPVTNVMGIRNVGDLQNLNQYQQMIQEQQEAAQTPVLVRPDQISYGDFLANNNLLSPKQMAQNAEAIKRGVEIEQTNQRLQNQGTISPAGPRQSWLSKSWEVLANPAEAFGYAVRNEYLPDNFSKGNTRTTGLNNIVNIINPASWVNSGFNAIGSTGDALGYLSQGDFKNAGISAFDAGINALGATPLFGPEIRLASRASNLLGRANNFVSRFRTPKIGIDDAGQLYTQRGSKILYDLPDEAVESSRMLGLDVKYLNKLSNTEYKQYLEKVVEREGIQGLKNYIELQKRRILRPNRFAKDPDIQRITFNSKQNLANTDKSPLEKFGWFNKANWRELGDEMRGTMKNMGLEPTSQKDVEKFRKLWINQLDTRFFNQQVPVNMQQVRVGLLNPLLHNKEGGAIISNKGYMQGPPPEGSFYRIPSSRLYNPTPYKIKAVANTGEVKYLNPFDETNVEFEGADYVDEYPVMQGGGPYDDQKNWFESYIRSPKYKERIAKELFGNYNPEYVQWAMKQARVQQEVQDRLNNLLTAKVNYVPVIGDEPGWISGMYWSKDYTGEQYDPKKKSWKTMKWHPDEFGRGHDKPGNIYLETETIRRNPEIFGTTPLHEWSHAVDDAGFRIPLSTVRKIKGYTQFDEKNPEYKYFGMPFGYQDSPTEFIGRLQPIRYLLNKEGIYDARTKDFTEEDYEKMINNPTIRMNGPFQEVMDSLKGSPEEKKKAFIDIMNSIAYQQNSNIETAKLGGPYDSSWMLTNPKPEPVYVPKMQQAGTRQPIYTSDPRDPRLRMYQDSLSLYNRFKDAKSNYTDFISSQGFDPSYIGEWATDGWIDESIHPKIGAIKYGILKNSGGGFNRDSKGNPMDFVDYPTKSGSIKKVYSDTDLGKVIGTRYPIYKKPVQPVIYKKRILEKPTLESIDIPNIELTSTRPAITQPTFEQAKVDMSTPTKYSFTYPTFDKDVQKTMYFPDRSSWKTFVEQRAVSSQEGKDYGSATGQFAMGGQLPKMQFAGIPGQVGMPGWFNQAIAGIGSLFGSGSSDSKQPVQQLNQEQKQAAINYMLHLTDPRKIRMTTGQAIDPNRDLLTGEYDTHRLRELLQTAVKKGVPEAGAWDLAAMAFQETGAGKTDGNIGHVLGSWGGRNPYENMINAYTEKMKLADKMKITDPYLRLQVYNGLGKIFPGTEQKYHGFKMKKIYGVPVPAEGINMRKNPLYGKQIVDVRDNVLRKNPAFVQLMDEYYKGGGELPTFQNAGSRQAVTANLEDYKRWQDSVTNYEKGLRELALVRQKSKAAINNFSLTNPTNLVSAFGNLLFGDERGSRRVMPRYSESSVPRNVWYKSNSTEQQPRSVMSIGDPAYGTDYMISGIPEEPWGDAIDDKFSMYSNYGSFVPLYDKPVRQNLIYQQLNSRPLVRKVAPKPKPPRKLERPNLDVDLPEIQIKSVGLPNLEYKSGASKIPITSETPTEFSYTYPTGKYNEQKTIYFPNRNIWQAFVDQYDGLDTTQRAGTFSAIPGVYTRQRRPNSAFSDLKFRFGGEDPSIPRLNQKNSLY